MREIRVGEDVLAPDGERLGTVERLVVDPGAHRITHIVVHDRVVGMARLTDAGSDGLVADVNREELAKLPEVNPEQVQPAGEGWLAPAGHTLQHFLSVAGAIIGQGPYVPPVHAELDVSNVHEITPSSPVWSGRERLGHVAEVTTDDSGALIDFVLDPGLLRHRVRVPAGRVVEVVGNNVHVDLTEDELEDLPAEDVKGWIEHG
ncbi:MAG: PRC-barrel domain-containing protein [Candidatus Dormibacteraeota bacterium]|nr:PRC-barrel domain-containing protein [Candidatus Dormibacteraeota bacterium]